MDKALIAHRFSKASGTYSKEATAQQQIAENMIGLLQQFIPLSSFQDVLELGCGTGFYSRLLLQHVRPNSLLINDICSSMKDCCADILSDQVVFLPGDAECIPFPKNMELITSSSALQWFDDPELFFGKCHDSLTSNGYLSFTTFGKENICEIRQLTGKGLNYRTLEEYEKWLTPAYHIIHSEEEVFSLSFETPMQILYHLKQTGVTGTAYHRWTRSDLTSFCEQYVQQFGSELSVPITYHPMYIIAQKKA